MDVSCVKELVDTEYYICDNSSANLLNKVQSIKDFGITFDSKLTFHPHMQDKINKAYSILGIIKRNFIHMDPQTFVLLYKSLVRTHIEYANSVWCPYKKKDIEDIEKVHKMATKLVISLK